jgi:phosphotriesterase-related protein
MSRDLQGQKEQKEDADLTKFYMAHQEYTCRELDYQRKIMDEYKITIDYDTFGSEGYPYQSIFPGAFEPSDRQRIAAIIELCKEGYEKQLILSQDTCKKIHLVKYGGYGYAHILENIVPELTLNGVTNTQINTMLVENPRRILTC